MDWNALIDQLGGGLQAAVVVGLGWAVWRLNAAREELWREMLEQERRHSQEIRQTIEAVREIATREVS